MDENKQSVIEQTTVNLPFLDDEVPALFLVDGRLYIPVFAVCHALGIRSDIHIRRWRHLLLWTTAQKLPLQIEKQGKRLVWCLLISEVPFLYGLFNWQLVTFERRIQLYLATKEQAKRSHLAYQDMQQQYQVMRQALFIFLANFADIDTLLQHYTDRFSAILDEESSLFLASLIGNGRSLFQRAASHARKMIHDQEKLPIIDTFQIDAYNRVIDSCLMPLLPIVPSDDCELFFEFMRKLVSWRRELQVFWSERRYQLIKWQEN
jgi:hypothetical protein